MRESRYLCWNWSEPRVSNQEIKSTHFCWNSVGKEPFFLVVGVSNARCWNAFGMHIKWRRNCMLHIDWIVSTMWACKRHVIMLITQIKLCPSLGQWTSLRSYMTKWTISRHPHLVLCIKSRLRMDSLRYSIWLHVIWFYPTSYSRSIFVGFHNLFHIILFGSYEHRSFYVCVGNVGISLWHLMHRACIFSILVQRTWTKELYTVPQAQSHIAIPSWAFAPQCKKGRGSGRPGTRVPLPPRYSHAWGPSYLLINSPSLCDWKKITAIWRPGGDVPMPQPQVLYPKNSIIACLTPKFLFLPPSVCNFKS